MNRHDTMMGCNNNRKKSIFGVIIVLPCLLVLSILSNRTVVYSLLLYPKCNHKIVQVSSNFCQLATQVCRNKANLNRRSFHTSLCVSKTSFVEEVDDNEEESSSFTLSQGEKLSLRKKLNRNFLTIAAPAFVQLTSEPLASLVDTAYLGRLGPEVLGGAGMFYPCRFPFFSFSILFFGIKVSGLELVQKKTISYFFFFFLKNIMLSVSFFPLSML